MLNILVCVSDGLLKIKLKRILSDKSCKYQITDKPIKRSDLYKHDIIIIHTSYKLMNLYSFIENAVVQKLSTIIYITSNVNSNLFRKFKNHENLIYVNENKLDIELSFSISLFEKYSIQINELYKENLMLNRKLEESISLSKCKRKLIKSGMSEDEAHKYILKYAMNNHIDKIEACNRLLVSNSE